MDLCDETIASLQTNKSPGQISLKTSHNFFCPSVPPFAFDAMIKSLSEVNLHLKYWN